MILAVEISAVWAKVGAIDASNAATTIGRHFDDQLIFEGLRASLKGGAATMPDATKMDKTAPRRRRAIAGPRPDG
ncbi:hypothetical protein MSC49_10050 [Methylosinus sp. C49]|nr:hypothetical protein MSC49_10050 [Methylosinus sp. C49]